MWHSARSVSEGDISLYSIVGAHVTSSSTVERRCHLPFPHLCKLTFENILHSLFHFLFTCNPSCLSQTHYASFTILGNLLVFTCSLKQGTSFHSNHYHGLHDDLFGIFTAITLPELGLFWIYSFLLMLVVIFAGYMVSLESEMHLCMWFSFPECVPKCMSAFACCLYS